MKVNVCLVHPPSIYDFRKKDLRYGPISDVVPSTPLFEMYPVGFISMLNSLVENGYNARISNIAVLMLGSGKFDAEKYLSGIEADIFGIDLHWLPHVHGAINLARIIKELHPESKVLMGGYSSTYFSNEIMTEFPFIDFILKGDLQENTIVALAEAVEGNRDLSQIPNLLYREGNKIRQNQPATDPRAIDQILLNYNLLMKNAIKYGDVKGHLPYKMWIKNPSAMTLIEHGCQYNCGFCGGSNFAFSHNYFKGSPIFRNPDRIAEELEIIQDSIGTPVFIAGDIYAAGEEFQEGFFMAAKERGVDIPLLTEYFVPPAPEYFQKLSRYFPDFTAEISPDSSNENIRLIAGRGYSNHDLEKSILNAAKNGCRKFDVYFTIGLPKQKREDVIRDVEFSEYLMSQHIERNMEMHAFLSPLTPFLDPGSLFYEMHDKYGITLRAKTLGDYYMLLDQGKSWEDYLNYETSEMTREDLVNVTYEAGKMMAQVRERLGLITKTEMNRITKNIDAYRDGSAISVGDAMGMHLNYMIKEIEWSRRHNITYSSFLIFLYRYYDGLRNRIHPS
jgi:B12-binding domain/radical SAM domain protein